MKVRIKFSKHGPVKYIGHLDIMFFLQVRTKALKNLKDFLTHWWPRTSTVLSWHR